MTFPKRYADRVAKLRVTGGFVLAGAFILFSHPSAASLAAGLPVSAAGLGLRAWAAGNLAKDSTLALTGPYSLVRNPLYIGTCTAAAGFAIASASWPLALLFAIVFVAIYLPVIELEEQHLRDLFPGFPAFAASVPRLVPRTVWSAQAGSFQFALYRKNREYQAAFGFLAAVAILVVKMVVRR